MADHLALRVAAFDELNANTLYALLRLRVDIFVAEQGSPYPDLDGRDTEPGTRHLWLAPGDDRDDVHAYLRLLREPDGAARIARVCTAAKARGGGLSTRLVAAALDLAGDRPIVLDAQSYLVDFYTRYGFQPCGTEFVEDGVAHVPMRRPRGGPPLGVPGRGAQDGGAQDGGAQCGGHGGHSGGAGDR